MRKVAYTICSLYLALSLAGCGSGEKKTDSAMANDTTGVLARDSMTAGAEMREEGQPVGSKWDSLDFNLPEGKMHQLRRSGSVNYRGNDERGAYSLVDTVLFRNDEANLSQHGAEVLEDLAKDMKERFPEGWVKIYGFADTVGHKAYNKELSDRRAEVVMQYLVGEGKINADRITTQAMGERNPLQGLPNAASRRVVIVARK